MTSRARARRHEAGLGTLEYIGMVAAVALVVTALIASATTQGQRVASAVAHAICEVGAATGWTGGCAAPATDASTISYDPTSCTVATSSEKHEVEGSIAFVDLGGGRGVSVKEVRNDDGSSDYIVTVTTAGEAGLSTGAGGGLTGGDSDLGDGLKAGYQVDVSGTGSYTAATSYKVDSPEAAQALADQLMGSWDGRADGHSPYTTGTTWAGEGTLSGDAGLTGGYTRENKKGEQREGEITAIGVDASGTIKHSWETTFNHETQETTYVTTWDADVEGGLDLSAAGGVDGDKGWGTALAITRDANNQVTQIRLVTLDEGAFSAEVGFDQSEKHGTPPGEGQGDNRSSAGATLGGGAGTTTKTVTTIDLAVTDDNRAIVDAWLGDDSNWRPGQSLETYGLDATVASSDPMLALLHHEAQVTRVVTEDTRTTQEIGASIKFGLKFGLGYTHTSTDGSVIGAEYADAPSGGKRPWRVMDVCF